MQAVDQVAYWVPSRVDNARARFRITRNAQIGFAKLLQDIRVLSNVLDQVSVASHHFSEDEIDEDELEGPDCKAVFKENLKKVT